MRGSSRCPVVALYLLDQDPATTSSLGILRYSRDLVHGLATIPDPGFMVHLWLSKGAESGFVPSSLPSWMRVTALPGRFGTGGMRIVADHLLAAGLAWWQRPDVIHFPKGFLPFTPLPHHTRILSTLHDDIVQYYRKSYPVFFPRLKMRYFDRLTLRAIKRADHVLTLSRYSEGALRRLGASDGLQITVTAPAGIEDAGFALPEIRRGIWVIGSSLPHKATAETLRCLDAFAQKTGFDEPVTVSGVNGSEAVPGFSSCPHLHIQWVGRLPFERLQRSIAGSRALVVLSEVEGFGIPVLEAYSLHTPVCYRSTSALGEVLAEVPGGWDGQSYASFVSAMQDVLALSPRQIQVIRDMLAQRYDWQRSLETTVAVYRRLLARGE